MVKHIICPAHGSLNVIGTHEDCPLCRAEARIAELEADRDYAQAGCTSATLQAMENGARVKALQAALTDALRHMRASSDMDCAAIERAENAIGDRV